MTAEDFESQRAVLNSELTQLALTGADTARTREKIAKLDQREQVARDAEQAAARDVRAQRELNAVSTEAQLSMGTVLRLQDAGIAVSDHDAATLALLAHGVARHDPEIEEIEAAHDAAFEEVERISARIDLLCARASALQNLRLTDQGAPRDLAEAATIEKDLNTLQRALTNAEAKANATKVPDDLREMRRRAMEALSAYEAHVVVRTLHERVHAAEQQYLDAIRDLLTGTGSRTAVGVYRRSAAFDKFVRLGTL